MQPQNQWYNIIAPVIIEPVELVGVESVGGGKHSVIRVYLDKPGGINLDEIAHWSRQISVVLDVHAPSNYAYTLEVSSPGLNRLLFKPNHFKERLGQQVKIHVNQAGSERHGYIGILMMADDESITISAEGQEFSFSYADIQRARIVPDIQLAAKSK